MFDDYIEAEPFDGMRCSICRQYLRPRECRRPEERCDDCEFDTLTPPSWMELFMAALAVWTKQHKAS